MNDATTIPLNIKPMSVVPRLRIMERPIRGTRFKKIVCGRCEHCNGAINIFAFRDGSWWCDFYGKHVNEKMSVDRNCVLVTEQMVNQ